MCTFRTKKLRKNNNVVFDRMTNRNGKINYKLNVIIISLNNLVSFLKAMNGCGRFKNRKVARSFITEHP